MRERGVASRTESDARLHASSVIRDIDDVEQPLMDLRTRLVLWILCLFFLSLVYVGFNGPPV
jgi:hypothetical protein